MPLDRVKREVYTMRLLPSERLTLEAAAARARLYTSEYLRKVGLEAARRDLAADADDAAAD